MPLTLIGRVNDFSFKLNEVELPPDDWKPPREIVIDDIHLYPRVVVSDGMYRIRFISNDLEFELYENPIRLGLVEGYVMNVDFDVFWSKLRAMLIEWKEVYYKAFRFVVREVDSGYLIWPSETNPVINVRQFVKKYDDDYDDLEFKLYEFLRREFGNVVRL